MHNCLPDSGRSKSVPKLDSTAHFDVNRLHQIIVHTAHEQSGLWDIVGEISQTFAVDRREAFELLVGAIRFIEADSGIYLIKSDRLYRSESCEVLPKNRLSALRLDDVEFREGGPFYYLSNMPGI